MKARVLHPQQSRHFLVIVPETTASDDRHEREREVTANGGSKEGHSTRKTPEKTETNVKGKQKKRQGDTT